MCISYLVHSVEESSLENEGGTLNSNLKDELVPSGLISHGSSISHGFSISHGKKLKKNKKTKKNLKKKKNTKKLIKNEKIEKE